MTRQDVSRNGNRRKKDPLVKDNTTYGEIRRNKKCKRERNSGIRKLEVEEGTNAESDSTLTVENKEPGSEGITYAEETEGPAIHDPDEPDRKKLKSAKELALRAKREEW